MNWTDAAGNVWLFGGLGYDSAGTLGYLNDLWKYSAGQWTWMGGSNVGNQEGTYGTQGTAAAGNVPGARERMLPLGPMRPGISGSSGGRVTTQRGHRETSTTCGSTSLKMSERPARCPRAACQDENLGQLEIRAPSGHKREIEIAKFGLLKSSGGE